MVWSWWSGDENKDVDAAASTKDAGMMDDAGSLIDVSAKMQGLLDTTRNKYEDKYKDVKLRVTVPALIQLVIQAEAKAPSDQEFQRDALYNKAGDTRPVEAKEFEHLKQSLNFAEWAYLTDTKQLEKNLESCGYSLLKHERVDTPGIVGYFIAIMPDQKTAVIGVKGTSSLTDVITDCCAATTKQTLDRSFSPEESISEIYAHDGILISSNALAKSLKPFVKDLFLPLGYRLLLCGHSLGAGAASLTGVLLRSQHPELQTDNRLQVMAFASPPVLNAKAAHACAPFTTTIVNNGDVITRSSLNNVEVLLQILSKIQVKLVEAGMDPVDRKSTSAYLSKIREGKGGEMIMTAEEGFDALYQAQEAVSVDDFDHLYVPGKVVLLYKKWQDRKKRREELEAMKLAAKEKGEKFDEKAAANDLPPLPVYCIHAEGTATPLRFIEIDDGIMNDHLTASYHMMVDGLKK